MVYIILFVWIIISIITIAVLVQSKKLIKNSKVHKWVIYIFVVFPTVILLEYYLYNNTQTLTDFGIATICLFVAIGSMTLYTYIAKKVEWIEYMLFAVIIILYGIMIVLNHYLLAGFERTVIITWGLILIINLYRSTGKHKKIKIVMCILTLIICMFLDRNIAYQLKLDTKIARTVIEYAIEEDIATSNDVDTIIYDYKKGERNEVLLLYNRMSEKGFKNTASFIYYDGKVSLKMD